MLKNILRRSKRKMMKKFKTNKGITSSLGNNNNSITNISNGKYKHSNESRNNRQNTTSSRQI